VSKGFFHNHPGGQARADEAGLGKLLDHGGKIIRCGGEIENVLGQAAGFGEVIENLFEGSVGGGIVKISLMIGQARDELFPLAAFHRTKTGKFVDPLLHFLAELLVLFGAAGKTDDRVVLGQDALVLQAKKGGDEFPAGEIPAGAENHHDKGRKNLAGDGRRGSDRGGGLGFGGGGDGTHGELQW